MSTGKKVNQIDPKFIGDWIVTTNETSTVVRIIPDGQYLVTQHYPNVVLIPTSLTLPGNPADVFTPIKGTRTNFNGEWVHLDKKSHLTFNSDQTFTWNFTNGDNVTGIFESTIHPQQHLTFHTYRALLTTSGRKLTIRSVNETSIEYYFQAGVNSILLFNRETGELEQTYYRI